SLTNLPNVPPSAARRPASFARSAASTTNRENCHDQSARQRRCEECRAARAQECLRARTICGQREQITAQRRHRYATDPEYRAEKLARGKRNRGKRDWIRRKYGLSEQDLTGCSRASTGCASCAGRSLRARLASITPTPPSWCALSSARTATSAS